MRRALLVCASLTLGAVAWLTVARVETEQQRPARGRSLALVGLDITEAGCVCIGPCLAPFDATGKGWCWTQGRFGGYGKEEDLSSCGQWYGVSRYNGANGRWDYCEERREPPNSYKPIGGKPQLLWQNVAELVSTDLRRIATFASIAYCLHGNQPNCYASFAQGDDLWSSAVMRWSCPACAQLNHNQSIEPRSAATTCASFYDIASFAVYDRDLNAVIISVQGTVSDATRMVDATTQQFAPWTGLSGDGLWQRARVHAGFYSAFEELQGGVYDMLDRLHASTLHSLPVAPKLIVTGHSLGAAVASLLAFDLGSMWDWASRHGRDPSCGAEAPCGTAMPRNPRNDGLRAPWRLRRPAVVAFASPRVGNAAFAELYARLVTEHYNFYNAEDIIPAIPWMPGSYVTNPGWAVLYPMQAWTSTERAHNYTACYVSALGQVPEECRVQDHGFANGNIMRDAAYAARRLGRTDAMHCMLAGQYLCSSEPTCGPRPVPPPLPERNATNATAQARGGKGAGRNNWNNPACRYWGRGC